MICIRYQLPNGEIVRVDATAAKAESAVTFQMKGGRIVMAKLVDDAAIARRLYRRALEG